MAGAPQPRFDQINLVVRDMKAMVAFYGLLGIEVGDMPPPWDEHHLETGEHTRQPRARQRRFRDERGTRAGPSRGTGAILSFRVDDRDEVDRLCGVLVDAGGDGDAAALRRLLGLPLRHRRRTPTATRSGS